jgi:hypothetical protein
MKITSLQLAKLIGIVNDTLDMGKVHYCTRFGGYNYDERRDLIRQIEKQQDEVPVEVGCIE